MTPLKTGKNTAVVRQTVGARKKGRDGKDITISSQHPLKAISTDGNVVLASCEDGTIYRWDKVMGTVQMCVACSVTDPLRSRWPRARRPTPTAQVPFKTTRQQKRCSSPGPNEVSALLLQIFYPKLHAPPQKNHPA